MHGVQNSHGYREKWQTQRRQKYPDLQEAEHIIKDWVYLNP